MKEKKIETPLTEKKVSELKAGDSVLLSGTIFTARDAAHKRLVELIENDKELPVDLNNGIIFYVGPSPARKGKIIGSAGPTTSYRMDKYTPILLEKIGLKGMIGKGNREDFVIESIKKYKAVYFAAIGGAGALISKCIKSSEIIAYDDLGPEAIRKLTVENIPLIVAVDCMGNDIYDIGVEKFKKLK